MIDLPRILKASEALTLSRAPSGFQPWLLADLARAVAAKDGRVVFVAADDQAMQAVADAARYFLPELSVLMFPAWDCLPYDRASPALRATSERLAALHALQAKPLGPTLVATTVNAVTQRVLTPFRIRQLVARLAPGERIDRDKLAALLQANGYLRTDTVTDHGEYAVRGGLVDLFPSGEPHALRLDFFGDEIESVRQFDATDQRTIGPIDGFTLLPASEALLDEETIKRFRGRYRERFGAAATGDPIYQAVSDGRRLAGMDHWLPLFEERLETLFDHLSPDDLIVREAGSIKAAEARFEAIGDYHANRVRARSSDPGSYRPLEPDELYLGAGEWQAAIADRPIHLVTPFAEPESARVIDLGVDGARDFAPERNQGVNIYDAVVEHAEALGKAGKRVVLANYSAGSRDRFAGLLQEHGLDRVDLVDDWQAAIAQPASGKSLGSGMARVALAVLPLDHGFTSGDIALLTEQDMLGDRLVRRQKRKKSADAFLAELATLSPGDLVVHMDHGIGRYEGLTSIPVAKAPHDCVALSYAGGDKLYVPVENIDVLSRYGAENEGVQLDKLGGVAWQARKARMKERIREIAGELIKTAAERALRPAEAIEPGSGYNEFVDRFPYQETEDQDRAIADVIEDLAAGKPMDRLICGDVGFGKTEVALRAAFVAAMGGMQVALICPTTLLARQHYRNFVDRFHGMPVNIGHLSRLVTSGEAKRTKDGMADGSIDIVIGTHALLAKGIEFKRLGLVIVDEEQRFGVTHKERLKALKTDVHMLTLTATPIPRTLQMAMSGLRELSVIQTPPVDRLAVRTYVAPWDGVVIREALLREHYRGGQSFLVTPRIKDLPDIEEYLRKEVPEVSYVVAHGQMAASEVEERMSAFYDKKFDILVSTTIIESGLDIPSANTLIINRADRFGLAQLYQLRGRVGRSKTRAYAYLTTGDKGLTETAEKRLHILQNIDTLGAGFQIASHDLDIRGAGNLLGDEQSGHIKEVGFELYQSMLEEAILEAKAGGLAPLKRESFSPQINVDAPILIPENYVPDLDLRMGLYRRMNEVETRAEIEAFAAELIDRFGKLPAATQNLLTVIEIKLNCRKACVAKIDTGPRGALVTFHEDNFPDLPGLLAYVDRLKDSARLRPDSKLVITRHWPDPSHRLHGALQLSRGLAKIVG
ncbi:MULTISPECIES: transcription-repair coupling factor [unclassified Sphingomonas]|uniref:transcription-repair coupling factor n=1 Tax=unclassified Sphingomonas TaxID=196159 RepID=UPI0006F23AED|nr:MULTISPECIES: transcription-repair coupling factor [unclassified Sphingomonas]KQX26329.1 transcription-repair coupling factor [Sphingomonas sp. Root1294]KQY69400.1 transcription-repair coupling factor [Sphingomonas sp. Root50]KRB89658.1 transcription-repair coupling factor [Sphingomonas sp. Root720]